MSEKDNLKVTLELPASEFIDHEGGLLVRCPLNGAWVPLKDYYSENQGSLLPLVGNVDYEENSEHWVETGRAIKVDGVLKTVKKEDYTEETPEGEAIMEKVAKGEPIVWKETIRILPKGEETAPEGGTLAFNVSDKTNVGDKFGK